MASLSIPHCLSDSVSLSNFSLSAFLYVFLPPCLSHWFSVSLWLWSVSTFLCFLFSVCLSLGLSASYILSCSNSVHVRSALLCTWAQLAAAGSWAATLTLLSLVKIEVPVVGLLGPARPIRPAQGPRAGAMPATSILGKGEGTKTGRPNPPRHSALQFPPRLLLQRSSLS